MTDKKIDDINEMSMSELTTLEEKILKLKKKKEASEIRKTVNEIKKIIKNSGFSQELILEKLAPKMKPEK